MANDLLIIDFPQHQSQEVLRTGNWTRKAKQEISAEALRTKNQRRIQKALEEERRAKSLKTTPSDAFTSSEQRKDATPADCPICTGSGFRKVYLASGRYFDGRQHYDIDPCECQGERLHELRWRRIRNLSQITDKMRNWTFATFNRTREPRAYDAALAFAENPQGWLVLYGINGAGKTHLLSAIAQHLIAKNRIALYCVAPDVLDKMRDCFTDSGRQVEERHSAVQILNRYKEADVLLLDDLGAQNDTDWSAEQFYKLFDHRYRAGLPTVIATNFKDRRQMETIGFRTVDRMFDVAESVVVKMASTTSYRDISKDLREKGLAASKAARA